MAKTIVGLYDNFNEAQSVVNDLISAGFNRDQISIVANNAHGHFGSHDNAAHSSGGVNGSGFVKGAVGGAVEGGMIGGLTGLLASLALALVPGVGPVAAIGPISAFLTGAGLGAAGGGIIGALVGAGIPKEDAHVYAEGVRRGGTLVSLEADDARADAAMAIFNRHHPVDIDERSSYYKQNGFTGYSDKAPAYTPQQIETERNQFATARTAAPVAATAPNTTVNTTRTNTAATAGTTNLQEGERVAIPIVEEELEVGKRTVERGHARIHTRVIETPVEEQVNLREEHVHVERHAVNRPVNAADADAFREATIEVTEYAEQPVVAKQARVVEEVVVNKEATQRTETVRDTVRRTDVDVDGDLDVDDSVRTTTTNTSTTGYNR